MKTQKVSEKKKENQNERNGKESIESRILVRSEPGNWNWLGIGRSAWHSLHAKTRNMNQFAGQD